ncbi:hypothetical protein A3K56_00005 [Candidatus Beckwithbacteria bacterium RIFCSPHIGHO2_12_FULL_49_13]|nr:MAG: hypothetical protein A3K56_00005 [Candidatus Beckwithbacteria bacterium RIFCSPHIGHO2_12_FULL_49_13]
MLMYRGPAVGVGLGDKKAIGVPENKNKSAANLFLFSGTPIAFLSPRPTPTAGPRYINNLQSTTYNLLTSLTSGS